MTFSVMENRATPTSRMQDEILITNEQQDFGYDQKVNLPKEEMMPVVTENKAKSPKKPKKIDKLRHAEYYDMQNTFDELYAKSAAGVSFDRLMDLILSRDNILLAYRNFKRNDGSVTPGTDGLTIRDLQKCSPDELVQKVVNITRNYNPRMVRRKDIPKPNDPSKTRPLGIPCIWDRLIQQCILQVLEPICEARFSDSSYGFRPNRSCENAVAMAETRMQLHHLHYVVEVDIKGFFDNVDHSKLIKQIWAMGIRDKKLIYILKRILKAPIQLENGEIITPTKGTPQGGLCSPILANIVLNELDIWVESQWQEHPVTQKYSIKINANGSLDKGNGYKAMKKTKLKEMYIVRYADDFRIFCRKRNDAVNTMEAVKKWLKDRLHLEVSAEKTRVVNLKKQYSEFLGIKMRLQRKAQKMVVKSHICDKAAKRIQTEAKEKLTDIVRPKNGQAQYQAVANYNSFVMGVHNYYQMATCVSSDFHDIAFKLITAVPSLRKELKRSSKSKVKNAVTERYGKSKQMRYLGDLPIAPIGYVQMKPPMGKKRSVQKYTPEGRKEIHKNLGIDTAMMLALMRQPLYDRSAEYADNRISLYSAQYGKCSITGKVFERLEKIHCHHKLPRSSGGTDEYKNLVLVCKEVHFLIHAIVDTTIIQYLSKLNLNKAQIKKLNTLRKKAGNQPVAV